MASNVDSPPSFQPINAIELVSKESSKITGVSVYSGRAEVTRSFKFNVKTGQNQVTVNGLPNVLDRDSLRVEGRGAATIHDVTISSIPSPDNDEDDSTSPELAVLLVRKEHTSRALERCKKSTEALQHYLSTLSTQHVDVAQLGKIVKEYDATAEQLDDRILQLEKQLKDTDKEIEKEREKLWGAKPDDSLGIRAVIGVFADVEGEVEIVLIYAVHGATWNAGYDIRVDMQSKEEPVTLIYKAAITQRTGEDWSDVPLTLETATPTFGLGVPTLDPWTLSTYRPQAPAVYAQAAPAPMSRRSKIANDTFTDTFTHDVGGYLARTAGAPMAHRELQVSSKGTVSATFEVPGLIIIPSDNAAHNVTIVELKLSASLSWVCVPKKDTKTHLSAKIKNASQYALLRGTASVYVDGSFISRSEVPAVSPDESFDCPLGLDPSIRVTYHPQAKKKSQSGFYTKTTTLVVTQQITVHNTKTVAVDRVRIVDQVPVSEDAQIQVNLVSPGLHKGSTSSSGIGSVSAGSSKEDPAAKLVTVAKGITAFWDGADEPEPEVEALGRNGKLNWVCTVPPQGKVNLVLQWEVASPARTEIAGLF
ncbi:hypothetical protein DXG03_005126 [Asterophora parasitica]|uniref:Mucoidy inhibitor A n=1 Tax=Asterophora parasitica TaxID=117018 RepID=A0A9P7K9V2_9AGAR|nr:hypothetical protein DXG03_005126 [Asterophora parasitica]